MEDRNGIFEVLVRTLMEMHGIDDREEAKLMAKRSMAEHRKKKEFPPGGQNGKTAMVKMIDDLCIGNIPTCDSNTPFRTINGQCNNLNHPLLGAMSTPFLREIQVDDYNPKIDLSIYTDQSSCNENRGKGKEGNGKGKGWAKGKGHGKGKGNGKGKGWAKGKGHGKGKGSHASCSKGKNKYGCPSRHELPSARTVSHNFHTDVNLPSNQLTHMVAQFGQFVDHDITLTPESEEHDCCTKSFNVDDNCFPIEVSENDAWYGPRDVTCLEFSRSVAFCQEAGGPRNQVNAVSAFVDASNVYSSDIETSTSLRSFVGGKLKTGNYNLLPLIETDGVSREMAGDVRAFDMPGLATMHTLFLREHNRICDLIIEKHPDWTDEKIYQNARRIFVAEWQSIVFGQYLPVVLGIANLGNDLQLSAEGTNYDPNENPAITTEFATAAYRFGHSLLQGLIKMFALDNSGQVDQYILWLNFFKTDKYYENNGKGMEQILMGLLNQPAQSFDKEVISGVTNQLFAEPGKDFGEDLIARNIQRGRDHGIHGFCCYYKLFQDPTFNCKKGWEEKYQGISDETWSQLQTIYNCPSDIDLFTGGLAQAPSNDGITGQVFNQMKINQFKRSMAGDRFFFTHKGQTGSFTTGARQTLINRTLGSIICDNTGITAVPPNVFYQSDASDFLDCSQMPSLGDIDNLLQIETD